MSLLDREPFATFRAEPVRFAVGLPVVFVAGAVAGALLFDRSVQLALAAQLALQTVGFVWLYLPALRRRHRPDRVTDEAHGPARSDAPAEVSRSGPDGLDRPDDHAAGHAPDPSHPPDPSRG